MSDEMKNNINQERARDSSVSNASNSQVKTVKEIESELKLLSKEIGKLIKERDKAHSVYSKINEEYNSTSSYDKKIRLQDKVKETKAKLNDAEQALNKANSDYRELEKQKETAPIKKPEQLSKVEPAINPQEFTQETQQEPLQENTQEVLTEVNSVNPVKAQRISLAELNKAKEEINKDKEDKEKERLKKEKEEKVLPPEESLLDDITDEELEKYLLEEQKAHEMAILEAEQASYEGMTEEEIKEAKERKIKFLELQRRYNSKDNTDPTNLGDYQKNLDFSIVKGLKKFKVKLPKSFFKIIISVMCALLVTISVVSYIVLNKPAEPVVLKNLRLSQTTTYQTIGEQLDLRGLYLNCEYSDGTTKTVKVSQDLILRTSDNINSNYKITGLLNSRETAFVYFTLENFEVKLDITLTSVAVQSVKASLYVEEFIAGELISFEDVLVLAKMSNEGTMRIEPDQCSFKIGETTLTKNSEGFFIPEGVSGDMDLTITTSYNNRQYISIISISVKEPPEEEVEEENQEQEEAVVS